MKTFRYNKKYRFGIHDPREIIGKFGIFLGVFRKLLDERQKVSFLWKR
jgi:hypothetical protein